MAKISVDSSVLQDIVARLNSDHESLDEMSTSFKEDFLAIKNAGLFEKQFKIIQDKLDLITDIYSTVSNELGEHLTVYSAVEDKVSQYANDYMSYYSYSGGGYSGGSSSSGGSTESATTTLGLNSEFLKEGQLDDEIKEIVLFKNFIGICSNIIIYKDS